MRDNEFIESAKASAFHAIAEIFPNMTIDPDRLQIVWMCHILGFKKCLVAYVGGGDNHYIEVTYNCDKNELYVDVYDKVLNRRHQIKGH